MFVTSKLFAVAEKQVLKKAGAVASKNCYKEQHPETKGDGELEQKEGKGDVCPQDVP